MIEQGLHIVRNKTGKDDHYDILWYWQEENGWYYILGTGMKTQLTEDNQDWLNDYEVMETILDGRKSMRFTGSELKIRTRYLGKSRNAKGGQTEYQLEYSMRNIHLFHNLMGRLPGIGKDLGVNDQHGQQRA